jgi:hypothetical protein
MTIRSLPLDAPTQYFNVYAFNVTNPDDVEKGAKPILNQIGPFIYTYHYHFYNVSWYVFTFGRNVKTSWAIVLSFKCKIQVLFCKPTTETCRSDDETLVSNMKFERYNFQAEGSVGDPKKTELIWFNVPYSAIRAKGSQLLPYLSSSPFTLIILFSAFSSFLSLFILYSPPFSFFLSSS